MSNTILDSVKVQFERLLSLVGTVLSCEKGISNVQNKLRRHFNMTSSTYLCSNDFQSSLTRALNLFESNDQSMKYFTLLGCLDEQMKQNTIKSVASTPPASASSTTSEITISCRSVESSSSSPPPPATTTTTTTNVSLPSLSLIVPVETDCTETTAIRNTTNENDNLITEVSEPPASPSTRVTTDNTALSASEARRSKKINKLERRLSRLSRVIKELEEKDMSLEEMEYCDLYLVESNLKRQAFEVHRKLLELRNESTSIDRILYRPLAFSPTEAGHPLISRALEDLVNQTRFFPSFTDVLEIVEKVNKENSLRMSVEAQKQVAEKAFKYIGKQIKIRRMSDFHDIMKSRLPENFDIEENDPAMDNVEMQEALKENEQQALIKTEKIFEEYSQIDPELAAEVIIESSEDSTDDDNDEEEDDEEDDGDDDDDDQAEESEAEEVPADLPTITSQATSPAPLAIIDRIESIDETILEADPNEIDGVNRTFTVLSTASLPPPPRSPSLRRPYSRSVMCNTEEDREQQPDSSTDRDIPTASTIRLFKEERVQLLTPRRREHLSSNDALYNLYQQRLTNPQTPVGQKRSLSDQNDGGSRKKAKAKASPECVVLD